MTPLRMILIAGLIAAPILLLQWRYSGISFGSGAAGTADLPRPHRIALLAP